MGKNRTAPTFETDRTNNLLPAAGKGREVGENTGGQASIRRQDKLFKKVDNLRAFQRKVEILLIE